MPTVHTRYVTYSRGGRRRHASATATDIVNPLTTSVVTGGTYQALAVASITWTSNNTQQSASFMFWSVTGAASRAFIATDPTVSVNVGDTDVNVVAWYLPVGGGPGGPGISIDAFDVNAGSFVDDDFVSVTPDSNLTAAANDDGWVPTTSAENINAFNSLPEGPFSDWRVFAGAESVNDLQLQATANTSAVAFAFYQAPVGVNAPHVAGNPTWVAASVTVDAGGPTGRGPVPPWDPSLKELTAGLILAQAAPLVHGDLQEPVLELAGRQITLAAKNITENLRKKG